MRIGSGIREVVERYDFERQAVSFQDTLEYLSADTAEAIDPDLGRHDVSLCHNNSRLGAPPG